MSARRRRALERAAGSILLWALAAVGALSGLLWAGSALGLVQPLIVVSGSMSPKINQGDLLLATPTRAGDLAHGQVVTLPSVHDGVLVTHRIVELERAGDDVALRLQGDANPAPDAHLHVLDASDSVWTPRVAVPGAGAAALALARPVVSASLALGLIALLVLTMGTARRMPAAHAASEGRGADALGDRRGRDGGEVRGRSAPERPAPADPPADDAHRREDLYPPGTDGDAAASEPEEDAHIEEPSDLLLDDDEDDEDEEEHGSGPAPTSLDV